MRKIEDIKKDIENSKKMIAYLEEHHRTHWWEDKSIYFYPELFSLYAELVEAYVSKFE